MGVSVKAINDWLSVLQASNQIVLLEPWFHNISKRLVKSPKVYFCDSGLLCFLLGITPDSLSETPFKGQVWETLVFAELRKLNQTSEHPLQFWFYRDQQGREIDFVLEGGGFLSFAECKWTENPGKDDIRTVLSLDQELRGKGLPYKAGKHYLICKTDTIYSLHEKVDVLGLGSLAAVVPPE